MVNERIKAIRSDSGLSQSAFGKKLGVSRDVINNLELGRVEPKESIVKLICFTFQINEQWLLTGNGSKYNIEKNETSMINSIAQKYELNELETYLVEGYLNLNQSQRDEFMAALSNIIDYVGSKKQSQKTESPEETEARLLREEADAVEQGKGQSSALPATKEA